MIEPSPIVYRALLQTFRVTVYQFMLPLKPSVHFSEIPLVNSLKISQPDLSNFKLWKNIFELFFCLFDSSLVPVGLKSYLHYIKITFGAPKENLFFLNINHHKQFLIPSLSESNGSLPRVPGFKACDHRCSSF